MSDPDRPTDRRRHPRERRRMAVRFGAGEVAQVGHTRDISEGGIYLQAQITFPPGTVLVLQFDRGKGVESRKGIVRWSKDAPPAFRRSVRCGMGIEFVVDKARMPAVPAERPVVAPKEPPAPVRSGPPPEISEAQLGGGAGQRRQVSTLTGNTYEVLVTEYRGAWYVRVYQLPRTDGSAGALFRGAFWTRDEADRAVRGFLKSC